ncbi:unnamed protein product, partial [Didymodactylos carnosus]
FDNAEHIHVFQPFKNDNKKVFYEEFRPANSDTSSKATKTLSSNKSQQRQKRDIQMHTSTPFTTTVISLTTIPVTNVSSLYTSQVVQYSNISQTTSPYDVLSFTISNEAAERWANLIAMHDEELIPVDFMARQMIVDEGPTIDGSATIDGSGDADKGYMSLGQSYYQRDMTGTTFNDLTQAIVAPLWSNISYIPNYSNIVVSFYNTSNSSIDSISDVVNQTLIQACPTLVCSSLNDNLMKIMRVKWSNLRYELNNGSIWD